MAVSPALSLFLNFSQTSFSSRSSAASNSEFPELALPADAVPWVCASGATVVDKMSDSKRERLQICLAIDSSFKADRAGAKISGDSGDLIVYVLSTLRDFTGRVPCGGNGGRRLCWWSWDWS